jgi:hypothetical protein
MLTQGIGHGLNLLKLRNRSRALGEQTVDFRSLVGVQFSQGIGSQLGGIVSRACHS